MKCKTRGLFKALAVLTALLLQLAFISSPVYAAETAATSALDLTKTGSISVTLKTSEGVAATDGTLTFYKVADLTLEDGDMVYVLTDEFAESGADLTVIDDADSDTTAELAKTLKTWITDKSISGTEAVINSSGTAALNNITLGLYLVDQTTASTGYYAINAFLVSVPSDTDGEWVYDVDASPKTELLTEIPVEPPVETPPVEPPVEEPPAENPPEEEIIHTGQLNWPIPVLLIISAVCLFFGVRYLHKEDKKDEAEKEA